MKLTVTALMAVMAFSPLHAYDFISDNIGYTRISDTEVMVTANPGAAYPEEIVIPSMVTHDDTEYQVIGIGALAFYGTENILRMTVSEGVRSIGYKAFAACMIEEITMPSTMTKIGEEAFWQCVELNDVEGLGYVESIGVGAFRDCSALSRVELNDYIAEIPASAFEGCSTLSEVSIPVNVEVLGDRAFADCRSIRYVSMPDGIRSIGAHCFAQCRDLAYLNLPEELEEIGEYSLSGCLALKEQEWPVSVTELPDGILSACRELEFAYLGPSIRTVGANALQNCASLTTVSIGDNVERIGSHAFADCPALRYVYVDNVMPPTIQPNTFDGTTYSDGILYVRPEVVALYRQSAQWSKFAHVEGATDFPTHSGVEAVELGHRVRISSGTMEFDGAFGAWGVYSIDGLMVGHGNGAGSLRCSPGIYILHWSDGKSVKAVISEQ